MPTSKKLKEPADGFPVNRLVALLAGPTSTLAGFIAAYLATHAAGLHLGSDQVAKAITFVVTFVLTTGVHYAIAHKWLEGWQKWEHLLVSPEDVRVEVAQAPPKRVDPVHPRETKPKG